MPPCSVRADHISRSIGPPFWPPCPIHRPGQVVAGGFGLAAFFCASVMSGGFLTFGSAAKGLILNNYATTDRLALISRVGTRAPACHLATKAGVSLASMS